MGALVLVGTGLLGIFASVGTMCRRRSDHSSTRSHDLVAEVAKVAVPALLVFLYLEATYDIVPSFEEIWDKASGHVEEYLCRYGSCFSLR
jgi:hypothetical protein